MEGCRREVYQESQICVMQMGGGGGGQKGGGGREGERFYWAR